MIDGYSGFLYLDKNNMPSELRTQIDDNSPKKQIRSAS